MTAKAKVYVESEYFKKLTTETFLKTRPDQYEIVTNLKDSDIVVLTGGADIFPGLYGEKPIKGVYCNLLRDKTDLIAVTQAYEQRKFMVGICRGAQLLNCIPNGGTLWQDVDGHGNNIHSTFDCISGEWIPLNSVHHQMMRPTSKATILAWTNRSTIKKAENESWRLKGKWNATEIPERERDVEACIYEDTRSLCLQFHCEFGHGPTTQYSFSLLDKYFWGKQ